MNEPKPLVGLKKRLGINGPGIVIAVVAVIISLTGGAFAAAGLTASEKKQVKSIAKAEAKKYAGKPGAQGPQGNPGASGPAGPKGDKGDQGIPGEEGKQGDPGLPGDPGEDGESVVVTPILKEEPGTCEEQGEEGGAEVRLENQLAGEGEEICNGKPGEKGEEGDPWSPGDTLPPEALETGTWSVTGSEDDTKGLRAPISFFMKLPQNVEASHIHYLGKEGETELEFKANCRPGSPPTGSVANPNAKPGELCIWFNTINDAVTNTVFKGVLTPDFTIGEGITEGAGKSGAILYFSPPKGGVATASGTFAVRAPAAP